MHTYFAFTLNFHKNNMFYLFILIAALEYPPGSAAKVIYGTLLVATLTIFVFYTSVFTSFLAYHELKMPIQNLRDLIDSQEYTCTTVRGSAYEAIPRVRKP